MKVAFRGVTGSDRPLLQERLQREQVRRWWDKHETDRLHVLMRRDR